MGPRTPRRKPDQLPRFTATRLATLGAIALATLGSIGCADPLFSPNQPRTQYDHYDRIRGRYVTQSVEDEYGQKHPNLVGRLGRDD